MKLKNLDKQVVGATAYDVEKYCWGTILSVSENGIEFKTTKSGNVYTAERDAIYPLAENLRLAHERNLLICYEMCNGLEYPYYCPEYDEGEYEYEVVDITENNTEKESQVMKLSIADKNARDMADMLINALADAYFDAYGYPSANEYDVVFIRTYIDRIYNSFSDAELKIQEIYKGLKYGGLKSYVDEIFNEEVLHTCQLKLIDNWLLKKLSTDEVETIYDKINSLDRVVLLGIYNDEDDLVKTYKEKLGINELAKNYLPKKYKVKCVVESKYEVEVTAFNFESAKKMAEKSLESETLSSSCTLVESKVKAKNW